MPQVIWQRDSHLSTVYPVIPEMQEINAQVLSCKHSWWTLTYGRPHGEVSQAFHKLSTPLRYQTCSMPWGVLSLNVNSGKIWWSTILLSIAPDCPCYNVLYDRGFLWWNNLNLMKIGKNPLGSWIQGSAGSAGSWAFFSKFWLGKRQNWIGLERGI